MIGIRSTYLIGFAGPRIGIAALRECFVCRNVGSVNRVGGAA